MQQAVNHATTDDPNFVTFRAAQQEYCVDIMSVREIRGWSPATALPQSPPSIRGVINLRGAVVPIVDFNLRLGYSAIDPTPQSVIIIVQIAAQTIGLLVDEVSEILNAGREAIKATPDAVQSADETFITGVITLEDRMIRVVNLANIVPGTQRVPA